MLLFNPGAPKSYLMEEELEEVIPLLRTQTALRQKRVGEKHHDVVLRDASLPSRHPYQSWLPEPVGKKKNGRIQWGLGGRQSSGVTSHSVKTPSLLLLQEVKGPQLLPIREAQSPPEPGVLTHSPCWAFKAQLPCPNARKNTHVLPRSKLLSSHLLPSRKCLCPQVPRCP